MKIQIIQPTPINGETAQPGWVYEFDEPTGLRAISEGWGQQVADNIKLLRYSMPELARVECVTPEQEIQGERTVKPPNKAKTDK